MTTTGGDARITVRGRLDLRAAPGLRARAARSLERGGGRLVLDLRAVEFVDSAGLGVLVTLHREAARRGGRMTVVAPSGPAREIFRATRTEGYFHLADDSTAATVLTG